MTQQRIPEGRNPQEEEQDSTEHAVSSTPHVHINDAPLADGGAIVLNFRRARHMSSQEMAPALVNALEERRLVMAAIIAATRAPIRVQQSSGSSPTELEASEWDDVPDLIDTDGRIIQFIDLTNADNRRAPHNDTQIEPTPRTPPSQ
jgi:hypothetical protein